MRPLGRMIVGHDLSSSGANALESALVWQATRRKGSSGSRDRNDTILAVIHEWSPPSSRSHAEISVTGSEKEKPRQAGLFSSAVS
jgi:hypothetical protein